METAEPIPNNLENVSSDKQNDQMFDAFASILNQYNGKNKQRFAAMEDEEVHQLQKNMIVGDEETTTNQNQELMGLKRKIIENDEQSDGVVEIEKVVAVPKIKPKDKIKKLSKKSTKKVQEVPQEKKEEKISVTNEEKLPPNVDLNTNNMFYLSKISSQNESQKPSLQKPKIAPPQIPQSESQQLVEVTPMILIYEDLTIEQELKNRQQLTIQKSMMRDNESEERDYVPVDFIIEVQLIPSLQIQNKEQKKIINQKQKKLKNMYQLDEENSLDEVFDKKNKKIINVQENVQGTNVVSAFPRILQSTNIQDSDGDKKKIKKSGKGNIKKIAQSLIIDYTDDEQVEISQRPLQSTGTMSLLNLIKELASENLISPPIFREFATNHSKTDIDDFLMKFKKGKLHKFDFNVFKFTILDHRRLAELLVSEQPLRFQLGTVSQEDPELQDFLQNLYSLDKEEYCKLYEKIDKISQIKWWNKVLHIQKEKEDLKKTENTKGKKIAEYSELTKVENQVERELKEMKLKRVSNPEILREIEQKRKEEQAEIGKIRNMVSKFGNQVQVHPTPNMNMRKKIKFY